MNAHFLEAKKLLRLIEERDPQCARLLVKAIEEFNLAGGDMPIRYILLHIYTALPDVALSEKEKELLKVQIPSSDKSERDNSLWSPIQETQAH